MIATFGANLKHGESKMNCGTEKPAKIWITSLNTVSYGAKLTVLVNAKMITAMADET